MRNILTNKGIEYYKENGLLFAHRLLAETEAVVSLNWKTTGAARVILLTASGAISRILCSRGLTN